MILRRVASWSCVLLVVLAVLSTAAGPTALAQTPTIERSTPNGADAQVSPADAVPTSPPTSSSNNAGEPTTATPAPATAETEDATAADPAALDPATIQRVIDVLENDQQRQEVLETLQTLAQVTAPQEPAPAALVAQPVRMLLAEIDERLADVDAAVDGLLQSGDRLEEAWAWLQLQASVPGLRSFWEDVFVTFAAVAGGALLASLLVRRLLRGARRSFARYEPPTPLHFAVAIVAHALVRVLPVVVFVAIVTFVAVVNLDFSYQESVIVDLVQGLAFVTGVAALVRAFVNHANPHMRLKGLDGPTALSLERSVIRVLSVGGYGYFGLRAARTLGLPWTIHGFLENVLFFVTVLLFVRLVLRFREPGAAGLRQLADGNDQGFLGRFLPWSWVASYWHVAAILFGLAIYGAWVIDVPGGAPFLASGLLLTFSILFMGRLVNVWLSPVRDSTGGPAAGADGEDSDLADVIAKAKSSPLRFLARICVTVVAIVLILQVWGADVVGWLGSEEGKRVRDAVTASAIVVALGYAVWTILSMLIRQAIEETNAAGRPVRSNRTRTLLTIGRNVLFVAVWLTVALTALGELGVNPAPLIAGAGVIGLAVGFGSQQLVQDIITGFFILLEDTIAVGDVIDVGGKGGVVEAVSLRTVRLRGYDGQVHTMPYSGISTISNLTKDYSYYVFDVGVAYKENTDRVVEVLREIGADMQRERAFRRLILEPLEIAGVDAFLDSAVVVKARFKTRPLQQWTVGREFNRRMKLRFDELGIEIPFPQRTVHVMPATASAAAVGTAAD
ncbi:MAG: mechanosensitive ion channel domain-containing protein [Pseudomonadota bacterium]